MKICSICQGEYEGYGNNAEPINHGICCDSCNRFVTAARLNRLSRGEPLRKVMEDNTNDTR